MSAEKKQLCIRLEASLIATIDAELDRIHSMNPLVTPTRSDWFRMVAYSHIGLQAKKHAKRKRGTVPCMYCRGRFAVGKTVIWLVNLHGESERCCHACAKLHHDDTDPNTPK